MQVIFHISGKAHCRKYQRRQIPFKNLTVRSLVSQTLLVMGATMSPPLSSLLPPPRQTDAIIQDVILEIEQFARLAPSLRLSAEILREAEDRRRLILRSPQPKAGFVLDIRR